MPAKEAGITDPKLITYYNNLVRGKEHKSAVSTIKNKEEARLKNEVIAEAAERVEFDRIIYLFEKYAPTLEPIVDPIEEEETP